MKKATLLAIAMITAGLLSGCGGSEGGGDTASIKVGAVLSLTGQYAEYGTAIKRGMDLAIDKINEEGGIEGQDYEIVYIDSGSSVDGAKAAFEELISQGVKIVIGPEITELCRALIPVAARNKVYMISPSASSPSLSEMDSQGYFYRICPSDESEATQIAAEIMREYKVYPFIKRSYKRVLVLVRDENPYTEGLWHAFGRELNTRNLEYEILYFLPEQLSEGSDEVQNILAQAANYRRYSDDPNKMGAIVIFGYADDVYVLLKQFKERFFDSNIESEYLEEQENLLAYTASAVDTSKFFVEAANVSGGLVFPRMFDPNQTEVLIIREFVENYTEKYDQQRPDLFAAYGYDSALLVAYTLRREDIQNRINEPLNFRLNMNDVGFSGVTGKVDFQQGTGEVAKTPILYKMKSFGEAVTISDFETQRAIEARERVQELLGRSN